ncbi:hypothetical protein BD626DRAFT_101085 [Schizophyllum amplum]|uniref:DUF6593 domain-containing protein n=1 Tax=Schizophyllum amplum TaxID=97359 RepID=A0A550CRN8_9AGAR|nr:hypothetical protein BD626DRAFT_101085 [Auriculariopsis ampla]
MPTLSFEGNNPLKSAFNLEDGRTALRTVSDRTWIGRRKQTRILVDDKDVASIEWRKKTFTLHGQETRIREAKVSTSYWKQCVLWPLPWVTTPVGKLTWCARSKMVWKLGDTTYTVRGPLGGRWQVYTGSNASTLIVEYTPRARHLTEKSKPATLTLTEGHTPDASVVGLMLILYCQVWYKRRNRWYHCAGGCLSEVAGGG